VTVVSSRKKRTLGEPDQMKFSSAVFLAGFSDAFSAQYKKYRLKKPENFTPDQKELSGTVKTMSQLAFNVLQYARSIEAAHSIKLADLLLIALQAQRSETATTRDELEKCSECKRQKEVNFNDRIQLVSLMRFIVDDIGLIMSSQNIEISSLFDKFYALHKSEIHKHVVNKTPFVF
jgi:hypothetical protein